MLFPRRKWKDIKGYEGLYQVSNLGEVKSLKNNHGDYREKILKLGTDKDGYKLVNLCKNGKPKTYKVHRLVAEAFIPNLKNLPQVNHIDENKANNCVWNLEFCSSKYNANYGTRNRRVSKILKGENVGANNPSARKVILINTGEIFSTIKEAGRKYNTNRQSISNCCRGKCKSAGKNKNGKKLIWKYYEED